MRTVHLFMLIAILGCPMAVPAAAEQPLRPPTTRQQPAVAQTPPSPGEREVAPDLSGPAPQGAVAARLPEGVLRPAEAARLLTLLAVCALAVIFLLRRVIKTRTAALVAEVQLRSQRELELERKKRLVENVIESLPGLFYLHDGRRFLRWNSAFEKVTGLSAEQLSSQLPLSLIHEEDRELMARKRAEIFELGETQWEARLLTSSGVRWHHFTGKRMELDGTAYVVGSARDITETKLGQLELRLERVRARSDAPVARKAQACLGAAGARCDGHGTV